jgi:uncharacterized repeat protein (TIGR03803 family)
MTKLSARKMSGKSVNRSVWKMETILCLITLALSSTFAAPQAQYKVLYSFQGNRVGDGMNPVAGLIADNSGNLYGTTRVGGPYGYPACPGCGTVFELSPNSDGSWTESVIYAFCANFNGACLDGAFPEAALVMDSTGNLYGTTAGGGSGGGARGCQDALAGCGTVFELSPPTILGGAWTETVLYNFCSVLQGTACVDGFEPIADLTLDGVGNLYGTAQHGGSGDGGQGVVFELSPGTNGWTETVLYNFCSVMQGKYCLDGSLPGAGVTLDAAGNLYGTTINGGAPHSVGGGTVYKLTYNSGAWSETVLASSRGGSAKGSVPLGDLRIDLGYLYGTTSFGGVDGGGGVFKLSSITGSGGGVFFDTGSEGCYPTAGVTLDHQRNVLYGTASQCGQGGGGTVFTVDPSRQLTVLYSLCSQSACADGANPLGALIEDTSGNLYGTTENGGAAGDGVVFEVIE